MPASDLRNHRPVPDGGVGRSARHPPPGSSAPRWASPRAVHVFAGDRRADAKSLRRASVWAPGGAHRCGNAHEHSTKAA